MAYGSSGLTLHVRGATIMRAPLIRTLYFYAKRYVKFNLGINQLIDNLFLNLCRMLWKHKLSLTCYQFLMLTNYTTIA